MIFVKVEKCGISVKFKFLETFLYIFFWGENMKIEKVVKMTNF